MNQEDLFKLQAATALHAMQSANIAGFNLINSGDYQGKSNVEKIVLLDRLGFEADQISRLVNTTPGTVAKELSIARKKAEGK